jgi:hypothetical protein
VFVDPAGSTHYYKEFEINAINTTWDLCLNKPYLNGGYENSSRTLPSSGWDMPRARSAVHVEGEVGRPAPPWRQWTVELALPIRDLMYNNTALPPNKRKCRPSFPRCQSFPRYSSALFSERGMEGAEENIYSPLALAELPFCLCWYASYPALSAATPSFLLLSLG